ncbi:MAG: hypothetical protein NXI20_12105 [bacterium]|nr:hypothetical protein [bacterium]
MEENKSMSGHDSLQIINEMISSAKGYYDDKQTYFLLWGWVVAISNLSVYYMIEFTDVVNPFIVWPILSIPAGIYTGIDSARRSKRSKVKTHMGTLIGYLWMCFIISLIIVLGALVKVNYYVNPLVMLLTATPTFITGVAIRFKPLMFGGAAFWLFAVLGFLVEIPEQSLVGAAAIVVGYLIPGYLLRAKIKNESV